MWPDHVWWTFNIHWHACLTVETFVVDTKEAYSRYVEVGPFTLMFTWRQDAR